MKTDKYEIDMTTGSLWGKVLLFALPLALSSILQLLFNAADMVVVGRFAGSQALAAVGSTGSLVALLTNLFIGLSIGTNVLVSRYYAAKNKEAVSDTVHTSVAVSLLSGLILAIVGNLFAKQILTWMGSPEDVLDLSVLYLRIYFAGMPVIMLYNFGSAILRAVGDTRRPLYYLTAAGILNVILNLIFVLIFHMSVAGVALATVISQTLSSALILQALIRTDSLVHLDITKLRIVKEQMVEITRNGLPAGIQGCVFSIANVLIQSSVNSFGSTVMAGNTAGQNIEGFIYVTMNAFYQANISFTGQNVGAGRYSRINRVLMVCEIYVFLVGLVLGSSCWAASGTLLKIYTSDPEVIRYGMLRMTYICLPYALCGIMDTIVGSMRGMGNSIVPMITSLLGACALRVVWIMTVFRYFGTLGSLYISYPISWIVTFAAHVVCFTIIRRKFPKVDQPGVQQYLRH